MLFGLKNMLYALISCSKLRKVANPIFQSFSYDFGQYLDFLLYIKDNN